MRLILAWARQGCTEGFEEFGGGSVRISLRDSQEEEDPIDNGRAARRTVGMSGLSLALLQPVAGSALFLFGLVFGLYHWLAGAVGSIGADRHQHGRDEKAEPARSKA